MKVVIEYTKEQYGIVEEVLADYINDGWSECREDGSVIAEVDIPGRKITELVQKHINVNNQLSLLKSRIQRIINCAKAPFSLVVRDCKTICILR